MSILNRKPADRSVKAAALQLFCLVRRTQYHLTQIPGQAKAVANDVRDAWRESARPNV